MNDLMAPNRMMDGQLTVGIIAYNEEKRIQKCLESLEFLKKEVRDIHVILVDNNSKDKTIELAEKTLRLLQLTYTIIPRNENNLAQARNNILRASETRWIYMVDADCRLDNTTWSILIQNWVENPQIAARGGSQKFYPTFEILILLDEMRKSYLGHFGSTQMRTSGSAEFVEHVSTTHILYDKNALDKVGGFNPLLQSSAEDLDLSLRLRKMGYLLQFNPKSFLWHELAHSWREWARKAFRNGIWQTRLIAYNPDILKTFRPWPGILLYLVPLVPSTFLVVSGAIYLFFIFCLSMSSDLKSQQKMKLLLLFVMTHFLYASGEMLGVILAGYDLVFKRRLPVSTNS